MMGYTEQLIHISRYVHKKPVVLVYSVKSATVIRFLVSLNLTEVNKKDWFGYHFGF